jgi:Asp-tRNA(Asn)/Glu-tRNA(Gln) amidotransferase A subunit family amidase
MARNVEDTALAFTVMSGESVPLELLRKPKLALPAGWVTDLDEQTRRAWELVSRDLPEIKFLDRDELFRAGLTVLLVEAAAYHRKWATSEPEKYGQDVLALIQRGLAVSAVEFEEARAEVDRFRAEAPAAMEDFDGLLLPATAIVAPPIDSGYEVREPLSRFTRPFNTTGQPVVALPARIDGLPVGIQVVGRTNADTLRAGMWLEAEWDRRRR